MGDPGHGLPGHKCGIKRAVDKGVWAEQLEQDSWDKAAGTGKLGQDGPGQDGPGQDGLGQDSRAGQLV